MADRIQIRRDTAANWTAADPTLAQGEIGWEIDTDQMKVGDGVTAWSSLDYWPIIPSAIDYDFVSNNDPATDVTGAELEELSDGSVTTLHGHPGSSFDGAKVWLTSNQSIPRKVLTVLDFDSEEWDTSAYWTAGSPTRLTIPGTGKYRIATNVVWELQTVDITTRGVVYKNGAIMVASERGDHSRNAASGGDAYIPASIGIHWICSLAAADYLEFYVWQDRGGSGGGATDVIGNASVDQASWASIERLE